MPRPKAIPTDQVARPLSAEETMKVLMTRYALGVKPEETFEALDAALPDQMAPEVAALAEAKKRAASITHNTRPLIAMYDQRGYVRHIPAANVQQAIDEGGLLPYCPICGGLHDSLDPNACAVRVQQGGPIAYADCPICTQNGRRKRIYDDVLISADGNAPADERAVVLEFNRLTTPKDRLRVRLSKHMTTFHPDEAAALGVR